MKTTDWLLASDEPWTRYRTLVDILDRPADDPEAAAAYQEMTAHAKIQRLAAHAATWGEAPIKRHNDAAHPLHALGTLADFGIRKADIGMEGVLAKVLEHQADEGPFQSLVFIPAAFGGPNKDLWSWIACDAPVLLHFLLAMGCGAAPRIRKAVDHLAGLVEENGYRCTAANELGRFKGPGRRTDPCPIANVYALKALSLVPGMEASSAATHAIEMLLAHWNSEPGTQYYLFGAGKRYRRLKYPYIWYDLLHVVEALSRFERARTDTRFLKMVGTIRMLAGEEGRFTPGSMYQAWKGWSFADKKAASPWLTFLICRILKRVDTFS